MWCSAIFRVGIANLTVSNMICNGRNAVTIAGYLSDSVMNNIVDQKGLAPVVNVEREDALKNVHFSNICARMV